MHPKRQKVPITQNPRQGDGYTTKADGLFGLDDVDDNDDYKNYYARYQYRH